jgi:4-amino-4-deoxy-L-arabinose transferase-like glycosyltransferase
VHVPGAAARLALGRISPRSAPHSLPLFSHLGPALLAALACTLYARLCRRGGGSPGATALATAGLAVTTTLWVYARTTYADILQAACFTGFFLAVLEARANPGRRAALVLGAAAGLLVASKLVYAVALPGAALWLAWPLRRQRRELARLFAHAALAALPFAALVLFYNHARWGSFTNAGYILKPTGGVVMASPFGENPLAGLWGMFLSPGKSVFVYSPPLVLALWGLPRFFRRAPEVVWAMLLTITPVVLVYSRFHFWAGDWSWGARYLVFALPVLLLPLPGLFDDLRAAAAGWRRRIAAAAAAAVLARACWCRWRG